MFDWILGFSKEYVDEVFYITNIGMALPEKLSVQEERDVVSKMEQGDLFAKNELIEKNLRLVVYIAQKFENTGLLIDDLTSVGTIGLIKAVNFFKSEKNIKFATFASRCIENEILMFLRKNVKNKNEVSLDEPISTDRDGNELVLADVVGTDIDSTYKNIEMKIENETLAYLIELLSPRERYIMKLRYGLSDSEELTQKEVADLLQISQSYISRIEKKILLKLKHELLAM